MIQEMHSILECAKQCMQGAQERSKFYGDQKKSIRKFEVGQKIFLKVTPNGPDLNLGSLENCPLDFAVRFKFVRELVKWRMC